MEELLPVGSIVASKDKTLYMIIGYSPSTPSSEKQYDYIAASPLGLTKVQEDLRYKKDYVYINKSDIETVLFIGHSDAEFDLYKLVNEKLTEKLNELKKEKENPDEDEIKKMYEDVINEIKKGGSDKNEK